MRFMILRKADRDTEAGLMPDEQLIAAKTAYNEQLVKAGAMQAGEGLHPSAKGLRVKFSGGKPHIIDGPFTEAKELVAGFTMIEVESKQAAIDWVRRWPALDGGGNVEIEIREVGCAAGMEGYSPAAQPALAQDGPAPGRYMVMLKANEKTEAGYLPDHKHLDKMTLRNLESVQAGVMLAGDGLQPSRLGTRVKFSGGKPKVIDGPFAEAKELIAGFWVLQAHSKEEIVEWVKSYPFPLKDEAEIEIRKVFEAADFGEAFTPELREAEESQRARIAGSGKPLTAKP